MSARREWIVQRKILRGDWETIAKAEGTRKDVERRYGHLNGSVRAVSEMQAAEDYEAGRADNYRRKMEQFQ